MSNRTARIERVTRQCDGVGDIGLRGAGQQPLGVDAGGDDLLHQLLALRDTEGVRLASRAEQRDAVAAFGEQRFAVRGESGVVRRAVREHGRGRGAEDAVDG